jgi:hypothetical protein
MLSKISSVSLISALVFFSSATDAWATSGCKVGQVTQIRGAAARETPLLARIERLRVGTCVEDGSTVITRKNAFLRFQLNSPASVSVAHDSELLVGFPLGGKPTKLNLTRGEVRIKSDAKDELQSAQLSVLNMTIFSKTRGTEFFAEAFRDGQEAWVVVSQGSVLVRMGNNPNVLVMNAGQSIYFNEDQQQMPRVVPLDEREMATLTEDKNFKQSISQLLMIESGAEKSAEEDEPHDLTLDEYAAQQRAKEQEKHKAPVPLPSKPEKKVFVQKAIEPEVAPQEVIKPQPVQQAPVLALLPVVTDLQSKPPSVREAQSPKDKSLSAPSSGMRLEIGPAFYGDAVGSEYSAVLLTPAEHLFKSLNDYNRTDPFSLGAGFGYSHASKNDLTVGNWKLFALMNYRYDVSKLISFTPEFDLGVGYENVQSQSIVFAQGVAFYYAPKFLFELNPGSVSRFHPGFSAGLQDYIGQTGLFSATLELSVRIDF